MKYLSTIAIVLAALTAQASACTVTRDQYESLRSGMSYSQIVSILGCRGSEQVSIGTDEGDGTIYEWQGADGGSVLLSFLNGNLFIKSMSPGNPILNRLKKGSKSNHSSEEPSQYIGCYTSNGGRCPEEKGFRCSVLGKCD
jgi:hypothetical protein